MVSNGVEAKKKDGTLQDVGDVFVSELNTTTGEGVCVSAPATKKGD
jgi:hypothetical protein